MILKFHFSMLKPIIYNSDIKQISTKPSITPMEATLLRYENALETTIQQHCRNIFLRMSQEIKVKYKGARLKFVQIDNGANLSVGGKIRKWKEGTVADFPDVLLLASTPCKQFNMIGFVEFKRIGTPSQIKIKEGQLECQKDLQDMGWPSYITNNPFYFEQVICQRFVEFFEKNVWCG